MNNRKNNDRQNISLIIQSMFRYSSEVDVDFVRKSVRAIGRCAIKVEQAADRCVTTLTDLIQTQVNYVVQEAIIVIRVGIVKEMFVRYRSNIM